MNQQQSNQRESIRFLVFSASLRNNSLNEHLIKTAIPVIEENGGIVEYAQMSEFDCPSYNQDMESSGYFPDGANTLHQRLLASDAFIISSPEYNGSMPGLLKNTIDWVSRFRPQPFNQRHALLMSASPSMAGGNRGLWSLRIPLEHLGARVYPDMFSLAMAHQAFSNGTIRDTTLAKRFENNIIDFMNLVESSKHYPCIKKAWVEFLGEQPDPVTERVE
jgi:NAD(P)H-dependent FMN reductase